jgi:hypothetical protein
MLLVLLLLIMMVLPVQLRTFVGRNLLRTRRVHASQLASLRPRENKLQPHVASTKLTHTSLQC